MNVSHSDFNGDVLRVTSFPNSCLKTVLYMAVELLGVAYFYES
jgi:hypothetical protein